MPARTFMTMRAEIERDQASGSDPYGGAPAPNWNAHTTVPCRVWSRSREEAIDADKQALVEEIRAMFPLDADVTAADRIANVTDRRGNVLWPGPLAIQTVQYKHTHREMNLERVTA